MSGQGGENRGATGDWGSGRKSRRRRGRSRREGGGG